MKALYIIGMIALAFATLLSAGCSDAQDVTGSAVRVEDESSYVKIPVSQVTGNVQKHYFDADGTRVTYFTVLGSDGQVRTAFDACDVCGGRKGYRQQGTDVVCNNCGRAFDIDSLGTENIGGGCWPSFLSHKIDDGNILISKEELARGAYRFR
jgi:uncharacterized membrane protein